MSDSDDVHLWLRYAAENQQIAGLALDNNLLNPCLQNVQQAVEKAIKAVLVGHCPPAPRTHSIRDLCEFMRRAGLDPELAEDEIDLLDAIYTPSKYPPDSALAGGMPSEAVCRRCLDMADRFLRRARMLLGGA